MGNGVDALSEKEREALRLLPAGHDAKSAARELGISVHALNDRLRSARRKLETTSSKEAARLLLEAEAAPQMPVRNEFADDRAQNTDQNLSSTTPNAEASTSAKWLWKGLIIMSFAIAATVLVIATSGTFTSTHPDTDSTTETVQNEVAASLEDARRWLALVDAGDHEASYAAASETLRDAHSAKLWEFGITLRRGRGGIQDRSLVSVNQQESQSGVDSGVVEVLVFETLLLNGKKETERLVMEKVGASWKAASYSISK